MRKTREQWAALVAAFEKSSQSEEHFCAKRDVALRTFRWWRWRLRKTAPRRRRGRRTEPVKLLSVNVVEPRGTTSNPARLVIAMADVELHVEGADVEYVAGLVGRLRGR